MTSHFPSTIRSNLPAASKHATTRFTANSLPDLLKPAEMIGE